MNIGIRLVKLGGAQRGEIMKENKIKLKNKYLFLFWECGYDCVYMWVWECPCMQVHINARRQHKNQEDVVRQL